MDIRCPCCHTTFSLEHAMEDEALREMMAILSDLPRQLLAMLPERTPRPRLPKPPMSDAKRHANRERLKTMIAELGLNSTRGNHRE